MQIVKQIVDRLHVSATRREVIKAVYYALKRKARRDPGYRRERRLLYADALRAHEQNRLVYVAVMSGRF